MRRLICTICARGGSKGFPRKNVAMLLDKPLVAHSIAQAHEAAIFDCVAVSSDSPEILEIARTWGADHVVARPPELATDTSSKLPAIQHCVSEIESIRGRTYDVIVDLDPTSPLRIVEDISGAIALLEEPGTTNVITASPARRSPYFNLVELDPQGFAVLSKGLGQRIHRRQDSPRCFDMNASVYVWWRDRFMNAPLVFDEGTRVFVMPPERSVDIDSRLDFDFVGFLMQNQCST